MYVYRKTESDLYTVGYYTPVGNRDGGKWVAESDHDDSERAAERVHFLNGGERTRKVKVNISDHRRLPR